MARVDTQRAFEKAVLEIGLISILDGANIGSRNRKDRLVGGYGNSIFITDFIFLSYNCPYRFIILGKYT